MFQNWTQFLLMKCAGSALMKCSETQIRAASFILSFYVYLFLYIAGWTRIFCFSSIKASVENGNCAYLFDFRAGFNAQRYIIMVISCSFFVNISTALIFEKKLQLLWKKIHKEFKQELKIQFRVQNFIQFMLHFIQWMFCDSFFFGMFAAFSIIG